MPTLRVYDVKHFNKEKVQLLCAPWTEDHVLHAFNSHELHIKIARRNKFTTEIIKHLKTAAWTNIVVCEKDKKNQNSNTNLIKIKKVLEPTPNSLFKNLK